MPSDPSTVVARVTPGTARFAVVLDDLCADGDALVGAAVIDVPAGPVATVVGLTVRPDEDFTRVARLVAVAADRLRALDRRRLSAPVPVGSQPIETALGALGFRPAPCEAGRTVLVLDL